ncbi:MAG: DUF4491 family protein [Sphaerochaetaceae bacterium]
MNFSGIIIGIATFCIIGIFHPIVIYCEYHFTERIWPLFLIGGLVFCTIALCIRPLLASAICAIIGFSCFWSIRELKEQTARVEKGWFPANPDRKRKETSTRDIHMSRRGKSREHEHGQTQETDE